MSVVIALVPVSSKTSLRSSVLQNLSSSHGDQQDDEEGDEGDEEPAGPVAALAAGGLPCCGSEEHAGGPGAPPAPGGFAPGAGGAPAGRAAHLGAVDPGAGGPVAQSRFVVGACAAVS